jgi:hypothetical protein
MLMPDTVNQNNELYGAAECEEEHLTDPTEPLRNPDCVMIIAKCKFRLKTIHLIFTNMIIALYLNKNDWSVGWARPYSEKPLPPTPTSEKPLPPIPTET